MTKGRHIKRRPRGDDNNIAWVAAATAARTGNSTAERRSDPLSRLGVRITSAPDPTPALRGRETRLKVLRACAVLIVLTLLLAGCGSDDADPTSTTAANSGQSAPTATTAATSSPTEESTEELTEAATATLEPPAPTATTAAPSATAADEPSTIPEVTGSAGAPTPQLPATVTDYEGNTVSVTDVRRIIPLNGDIAEIIFALGMGGNVVATDISATYPAEAVALPKIGYQRQLAAEGILALEPTLVIGTETAGPPEVLEQLESAGVTVVLFAESTTIEEVSGKIQAVADTLGIPEAGAELAEATQAEIDAAVALGAEVAEQPTAMFLYVRGTSTQMIGGQGTAASSMIQAAGAIDAGAEAGIMGYQPMTAEALAAAQPDVLILLTAGLESVGGIEGLLEIPGIAQTPAGQDEHILDFDDLYLIGLGPRTGQALHDLVLGLHPELQ